MHSSFRFDIVLCRGGEAGGARIGIKRYPEPRRKNGWTEQRQAGGIAARVHGLMPRQCYSLRAEALSKSRIKFLAISWCREGGSKAAGLPDASTLCDMVMEYCARRGLCHSPEAYPWQDNAHYWLVSSLYSQMHGKGLSESELRGKCRTELHKMAKRIKEGEYIPPPRVQLEKLYVPASQERALAHIGQIKAMLKAKGTRH